MVLTPVMAGIAVWIRRDSPGPALFRQERIGYAGRPFTLLKFRSMVVGAQGMGAGLAVSEGDGRITRPAPSLRRLSLDELPQLWNIVRGDMSLVGPRPTVASQVERYDARQRRRLLARPGLTGLAQVSGRTAIPWSERIAMDLELRRRLEPAPRPGDPRAHRRGGAAAREHVQGPAGRVRPPMTRSG